MILIYGLSLAVCLGATFDSKQMLSELESILQIRIWMIIAKLLLDDFALIHFVIHYFCLALFMHQTWRILDILLHKACQFEVMDRSIA